MVRRLLATLFLCALCALCIPGLAPAARAAEDELVIGISQFPSNFHPAIDSMLAKTYVLGMTRRPFVAYDAEWKRACFLCLELPTVENGLAKVEALPEARRRDVPGGDKGIAVTLAIQPKAAWGDGTPVTTKDVTFAWKVGRHKQSGVANRDFFERIWKIDELDDKRFTVHLDRIYYDYPDRASIAPLPAHLEAEAFREPKEYKNRTAYDRDPTNRGLHYGPYRITKVVPGSHLVLVPNRTWYGKTPPFKRIVVRVIERTPALEATLRAGGIDYIAGELGLPLDQALSFERRNKGRYEFVYKPGLIYEHIDLNLDNPILKDRRVREALILGLDRETISAELFAGRQPVAHSFVSPLDSVAAKDVPRYAHDPKRAAQLLDAAGWTVKKRGIRHNATGERLTLELMTTAGNRSRELVEQVLQSQWRRIGIDVRIRNEPPRVFFGQTVRERRFTGLAMYAWISAPETVPRTTLHSTQIPSAANNYSGQNNPGFRNAEVDGLIDRIEVELDLAKRKVMWRRLQQVYVTELPVIPLYFRANAYILPKWLKGVVPTGHQFSTTLWIENWRDER